MDSKFKNVIEAASKFIRTELGADESKSVLIVATNVKEGENQQIIVLQGTRKVLTLGVRLALINRETDAVLCLFKDAVSGISDNGNEMIMLAKFSKN